MEHDLHAIESHIGKRLPRQLVAGFDYEKRPTEKLEVPLAERIAAIRSRKREERGRAQANAERRGARGVPGSPAGAGRSGGYSARGPQGSRGSRGSSSPRVGAGLAWLREVQVQKARDAFANEGSRRPVGR